MVKQDIGLTESERAYLEVAAESDDIQPSDERLEERGITGSYLERPDKLEEKVQERVRTLPGRLNAILEEIAILAESGHLRPSQWEEHEWSSGLYEDSYSPDKFDLPYAAEAPQLHERNPTFADEFGRRLGRTAIDMMFAPPDTDPENVLLDISTGFLSGLYDKIPIPAAMEQQGELAELLERKRERSEEFVEELKADRGPPEWRQEFNRELESYLVDVLEKNGFEVSTPAWNDSLVSTLKNQYRPYNLGIPPRDMRDGPPEMIAENDIPDIVSENEVMEYVREEQLVERQRVADTVSEDIVDFAELEWNDIPIADVINHVSESGSTVGEVAERMPEPKSTAMPTVAAVARYLAGEEHQSLGKRDHPPMFELNKSAQEFTDWQIQFTAYGKVVQPYVKSQSLVNVRNLRQAPDEAVRQVLSKSDIEISG